MTWAKFMTANLAGREAIPALPAELADHRPHVVVLTEAQRARAFLRGLAGYQLLPAYRGGTETADVAVLVRRDARTLHRWAMRLRLAWVGPLKGKRHSGRIYPIQRVRLPGGAAVRVAAVHFPTGGPHGPNARAWAESARRLNHWANNNTSGPLVAVGDFNALAGELADLASAIGAGVVPGAKVDHALVRGARRRLPARRLTTPAGMHGWLLYTVEVSA